jgi:propionate CoA-transferase
VVNLGVGIPDGVATVLDQEGAAGDVTFTVEHGIFGGVTAQGHVFGATVGHDAVVPMGDMFSFYHAGGLDTAFLGFAQVDRHGNANVSKFGGTVMGTGGFVDITQRARKVVLCGTLTAGGLKVAYDHGSATISQEGAVRKIVDQVDQITFSGEQASETAQQLVVVTDRAVFELTARGLTLTEVANGIDIEDDVLAQLGCSLPVADRVRRTEPEVLGSGPLSLAERMAERSRIGGSP